MTPGPFISMRRSNMVCDPDDDYYFTEVIRWNRSNDLVSPKPTTYLPFHMDTLQGQSATSRLNEVGQEPFPLRDKGRAAHLSCSFIACQEFSPWGYISDAVTISGHSLPRHSSAPPLAALKYTRYRTQLDAYHCVPSKSCISAGYHYCVPHHEGR